MQQSFLSQRLKKAAQGSLCGLLAVLLSASPPAIGATDHPVDSGTGIHQNTFTGVAEGDSVTISGDIIFANSDNAIVLNKKNLTLRGTGTGNGFGTNIGKWSDTLSAAVTDTSFTAWASGLNNKFSTTYLGGGITGGSNTRNQTGSGASFPNGEHTKWFTTPYSSSNPVGSPDEGNNLHLLNLHLHDVNVAYEGNRYVNGLIGNAYLATTQSTTMQEITGNAFTGIGISLTSNDDTHYLAGGGIIGVRSTSASTEITNVSGNLFDNIEIITTGTDPIFVNDAYVKGTGTTPQSTYLEGGGLVGVNAATSPADVVGHATMNSLANNYFTNVHILSNDVLMGGGLVGLNNNSKHIDDADDWELSTDPSTGITTFARLTNAQGNIFGNGETGNINVQVGYSLRGGGVLGINGLSSAQVELHQLTDNAFAGINVETGSYVRGGGIVGLQTNDAKADKPSEDTDTTVGQAALAILGNASNNLFLNEQITVGTYLEGGGVIGLRSNQGRASLVGLVNNVFKDITVEVNGTNTNSDPDLVHALSGGGIVGLSSVMAVNLGVVSGNTFDNLTVTSPQGNSYGGGIIGIHAINETTPVFAEATMGSIVDSIPKGIEENAFSNISVSAQTLNGGGIIGAANQNGLAEILKVSGNKFTDQITIETGEDLVGGGIVGVWAEDAVNTSAAVVPAMAVIDGITNNTFDATVNVGGNLVGGGIIGARSNNISALYQVANNNFTNNEITIGGYIDGGGIIGITGSAAYGGGAGAPVAIFKSIDSSTFTGNTVSAQDMVMGGLVYSYGLANETGSTAADGLTINNSRFEGNTMTSMNDVVYGTVTIDTGAANYSLQYDATTDPDDPATWWTWTPETTTPHTLTLTADNRQSTVFDGNVLNDNDASGARTRYNSLYMGTIPIPGGGDDFANADAKLIVNPAAGGVVALYDPIEANQQNGGTDTYTFNMEMNGDGHFVWGGANAFTLDSGVTGTIELLGGTTTLLDSSSTTTDANIGLDVRESPRYTMTLDAKNHTFFLDSDARLNVEGHNEFDFSAATKPASSAIVQLDGRLHFNLNNTHVYERGEDPFDYSGQTERQPLLTILAPTGEQGVVDLSRSNVTLSDEFVSNRYLKDGDRFYLIEVQNGTLDDPNNKAFTSTHAADSQYASMRHGTTVSYDFILDTNGDNNNVEQNTRYFVARIEDVKPSGDFDVPNNGRTTTVTFLQRGSDRLYDPLYDFDPDLNCDPGQDCDPCEAVEPCESIISKNPSSWVRTPFASVGGVWYRANSGANSYSDVEGSIFHGGLAAQKRVHNGRLYVGAFVDSGDANYGTYNYVSSSNNAYRGNGELESLGGGVLLRRKWDNGLRFDAMFRGGNIDQSLFSSDLLVDGKPIAVALDAAYWGGDIGLGREWKNRRNALLVFSRYSWIHEEGGKADFSTNEHVVFDALNSHRLISGARWTRQRNSMLSWYLGAAYEYEFDGASRAREYHSGNNLVLEGLSLRGGSGIGEIGMIVRSSNRFYLTTGLEGYLGKREGGSGFVSAQWKW